MSAYGISGFVDGFMRGRQMRLDEQDKKDAKERQRRMDELVFAQAKRDAETHDARMGAYRREEQDWSRNSAEIDRRAKEEAETRDAQRRAWAAAQAAADVEVPAGLGAVSQPQATPSPRGDEVVMSDQPVQPLPPSVAPEPQVQPQSMSSKSQPIGAVSDAAPLVTVDAPPVPQPTSQLGALREESTPQQVPPQKGQPSTRQPVMQADERGTRMEVPALMTEVILHKNGRVYDLADGREITDPQVLGFIKEQASGAPAQGSSNMAPNYGHDWGESLGPDAAEVGKRALSSAGSLAQTINRSAVDGYNAVANGIVGAVNSAGKYVTGGALPEIPKWDRQRGGYYQSEVDAQVAKAAENTDAATTGKAAEPPVKPRPSQLGATRPGPTTERGAAVNAAASEEMHGTAQQAMSAAATPAVAAAAESASAANPKAMGIKPGDKITAGQRSRAAKSMIDHYLEAGAPIVIEDMLKRGDFEGATKFQEWMQDQEVNAGMEDWAKAAFAATVGDMDGFSSSIVSAYNRLGYFPDGTTIVDGKSGFTYGKDGEITGAKLTFKDEATGNTFEQVFSDPNDLVRMGITLLAPEKAYEAYAAQAAKTPQGAMTQKEVMDAREKVEKRIDDAAKTIFEEASKNALTGGQPITYEEAREKARAAIMGDGNGAVPDIPSGPVPIMRRPSN